MARREFTRALQSTDEIRITVIGRSSGRKISLPVWFVEDGKALHLLPVKGSGTEWRPSVEYIPVPYRTSQERTR